jgi:hypothetical protein
MMVQKLTEPEKPKKNKSLGLAFESSPGTIGGAPGLCRNPPGGAFRPPHAAFPHPDPGVPKMRLSGARRVAAEARARP